MPRSDAEAPRPAERLGGAAVDARLPVTLVALGATPLEQLTSLWGEPPCAVLGMGVGTPASYARPGHADDRAVLAAPVDDRLFFAGEACSPNFFSTAHGAYMSGIAAAEAALASLGDVRIEARAAAAR